MVAVAEPTIDVLEDSRPPWPVVLGAALVGFVIVVLAVQASVFAEFAKEEVWSARSEVEFRDPNLLPETVALTFQSPSLWAPVAESEGITEEDFLKNYFVAVAGGGTQIVSLTFEDEDADRAVRVLRGIVGGYFTLFQSDVGVEQSTLLADHLAALEVLENDLETSLQDTTGLARSVQIDQQNQLTRVRQQITSVLFRLDQRETELFGVGSVAPRLVTDAFVAADPVVPNPARAGVFGIAGGGLVALLAIYLVFHLTAQPVAAQPGLGGATHGGPDDTGHRKAGRFSRPRKRSIGRTRFRAVKRAFDTTISGLGLLVLSPLLLVIALAVALTSRGPVIYKQERIGRDGQIFRMYKFRTMKQNNDDSEHRAFVAQQLANKDAKPAADGTFKLKDNRVTFVGGFLRRFSLDELPQLWNVFRGDMALVGPRPPIPWEWELFTEEQQQRALTRPGCTGLWQVSGRNKLSSQEMLDLDVRYVREWSLFADFRILLKTPVAVFRGDGAR